MRQWLGSKAGLDASDMGPTALGPKNFSIYPWPNSVIEIYKIEKCIKPVI
jgi:hypothetical protein